MTKNEIVKKNISLTFDFIRYLTKNTEMLDKIPDGAEVDFLELDLPMRVSEDSIGDSSRPVLFKVDHTFSEIGAEAER